MLPRVLSLPPSDVRYRWSENFVSHGLGGELLIVPIAGSVADLRSIFVLNGTGAAIWERLAEPSTAAEVTTRLCEAFEVDPTEAQRDVSDTLSLLLEQGLVRSDLAGGAR